MHITQSLQNFQDNINIEKNIGRKWGYYLDNSSYNHFKMGRTKKEGIKINNSVNPI